MGAGNGVEAVTAVKAAARARGDDIVIVLAAMGEVCQDHAACHHLEGISRDAIVPISPTHEAHHHEQLSEILAHGLHLDLDPGLILQT